jgi:hypothetical protein
MALSAGVSSISIGASDNRPSAVDSFSQSSAARRPGAQLVLVEAPDRSDHAHRELRGAHFHREHDDRQLEVDRDVLADVQCQRGLPHARSARHDDEVPRLQARRFLVEIGEAGCHARDVGRIVAVVERPRCGRPQ